MPVSDWCGCGLRRPSRVRLGQRFETPAETSCGTPLGPLPAEGFAVVAAAVAGD